MPIISLIAKPLSKALNAEIVFRTMERFRGKNLIWLDENHAAEFYVDEWPPFANNRWKTLQNQCIDMAITPDKNRKKKLLIADMDSTMIDQECIDELADAAGVGPEVAAVTAKAMNGEIDFEAAIDERVAQLIGLDEGVIEKVLLTQISLASGGQTLLATMKAHGSYAALVSGGFTAFTGAIASQLGFDEHRANTLEIVDRTLTGKVVRPILGQQAKIDATRRLMDEHALGADDVLAVGDGANDLGMLNLAGMGVALHAKPNVQKQSDICINFGDLTALLFLQGYKRSEFVSL